MGKTACLKRRFKWAFPKALLCLVSSYKLPVSRLLFEPTAESSLPFPLTPSQGLDAKFYRTHMSLKTRDLSCPVWSAQQRLHL